MERSDGRSPSSLTLSSAFASGIEAFFAADLGDRREEIEQELAAQGALVWLGLPHEGMTESRIVVQLGACPNQHTLSVAEWAFSRPGQRLFLVGTHSKLTGASQALIRALAEERGASVVGGVVSARGALEAESIVRHAIRAEPTLIFSTLDEVDNPAFYQALKQAGWNARRVPVLSTTVQSEDLKSLGPSASGHLRVAGYFAGLETRENQDFQRRMAPWIVSRGDFTDPFVTGYYQVRLWCCAVELAGSPAARVVASWLGKCRASGPFGEWALQDDNHAARLVLLGEWNGRDDFEIVWSSGTAVPAMPWLGVERLADPARRWSREAVKAHLGLQPGGPVGREGGPPGSSHGTPHSWNPTPHRQRVQDAAENPASYGSILNGIGHPVWTKDLEGNYLTVNPAWGKAFGLTPSEVVGHHDLEVFPSEWAAKLRSLDRLALETRESVSREEEFCGLDGRCEWYQLDINLLINERGEPWGWAGTAIKRTKQKPREDALIGSNTDLRDEATSIDTRLQFAIAVRDQTQQELVNNRTLLADALSSLETHLSNLPIAVLEWDLDGRLTRWSSEAARTFGRDAQQVLGRDIFSIGWLCPENSAWLRSRLNELMDGGKGRVQFTLEFLRPDGSSVICDWYVSALCGTQTTKRSMLGYAIDTTQRHRDSQALRRSEERLRLATLAANLATYSVDLSTGEGDWSDEVRTLLGLRREDPVAMGPDGLWASVHPDDRLRVRNEIDRSHDPSGDGLLRTEYRIRREGLGDRWIRALGQTEFTEGSTGRVASRDVGVVMDVTDARRAKERIRRLSTALEESPIATFLTNEEGLIEYVNEQFSVLTEYSAEEAIGQSPRLLKSGQHLPEFYEMMWSVLKSGKVWTGEICNRKKGGAIFRSTLSIAPIRGGLTDISGYVAIMEDNTAKKDAEQRTRMALEAERAAAETMRRFLAMTSHEFRTPLASIQINIDMMADCFDRMPVDSRKKTIHRIRDSLGRLRQMLDQVAFVNRAEQRRLPFRVDRLDLVKLIQATIIECAESIGRQHCIVHPDASWQAWMQGDRNLLWTALSNLLNNAVQYSRKGSTVSVSLEELEGAYLVKVADQGVGIPVEDRQRVFQMFERGSNVSHIKGTGLGLAIVCRCMELHGGHVFIESTGESGTVFCLQIPKVPCTAPELKEGDPVGEPSCVGDTARLRG